MSTRRVLTLLALLTFPSILWAGANTWTGSGGPNTTAEAFNLVAASPTDPYVVYGAFGRALHRSGDGGRTWDRLRTSFDVWTLLVHPASPSTIYVAGYDASLDVFALFRSPDAGNTWSRISDKQLTVLAGSPTDPNTLFGGDGSRIYRSADAGATWIESGAVTGWVASLVIDRREPTTVYAGAEGYEYWGFYPGALIKSTDGGVSWQDRAPEALESATAVAVDHVANSTVYAAVGPYTWSASATRPNVLRSEDGGASWVSGGAGLPGSRVGCLAVDPRVSGTLYAGTDSGVYRSRDGGRSWTPFGQRLAGLPITSLAIDESGFLLHAGTNRGIYDFEIANGPVDVAAGPASGSRLLSWSADRLSVATLDASGHWESGPLEDPSATWTAIAIATASGGADHTHVLWQSGDGRSALEILGPGGRQSTKVFAADFGWIASDLSVRGDGRTSVLWTNTDGRMRIATVDSSGAADLGPEYGPAAGWTALALDDDAAGQTRVLWRSADGRAALSLHRDGAMLSSFRWPADPSRTVEDIAVGADGRPRLLRISPDGTAEVSIVETSGALTSAATYGSSGLTPRRIAAGTDGLTRLLFSGDGGVGDLVVLGPDNTLRSRHAVPAANAATLVVTTGADLEAALVPANAGAQILVRAGEYELSNPLTVPDRAILAGEGVMTLDLGTGNRLEIAGSANAFAQTNESIDPPPPAEFVTSGE